MTGIVTRFLVSVIKCCVFHLDFQLKATFAVVPTDNICGRSLSLKISFDMNSIKNLVTIPVISDELGKIPGSVYDKWNISVVIKLTCFVRPFSIKYSTMDVSINL
jgi:hypothetical protein